MKLANDLFSREVLGKGFASPLSIDPHTKEFAQASEEENVRMSIENLLATRVGERVMNEDIGTEMPRLLFGLQTGLVDVLPKSIKDAIARYEPRVKNVRVEAVAEDTAIRVTVSYTVITTNRPGNIVYPYYLEKS